MSLTAPLAPTGLSRALALRQAVEALDGQIAEMPVPEVPVPMASQLAELLSRHERKVAALRIALVRREVDDGHHEANGARDPVGRLAQLTGTARGKARAELHLAQRLERLPKVGAAVRDGEVSADQAKVIAAAAEVDPDSTDELLAAARTESLGQLRQRAIRAERAAHGEEAQEERERRVHEHRYCRMWTPEGGGVRLEAWLTTVDGAKVAAALEKKTGELLRALEDAPERVRADALVDLVTGDRVATEVAVRVDAAALVRGAVEAGEACEVPGVGPISVKVARALLGEAFLTLVVTKGVDIATVTSTTRVIPRKVRKALEERDRCCVVPGCGATYQLEIDHWRVDFEKTGPTELDNLCRLCSVHHRQKTNGIIALGGGPGKWYVKPGRMAGRTGPTGRPPPWRRASQPPPGRRASQTGPAVGPRAGP